MIDESRRTVWAGDAPGGNYTLKVQALAEKMGVGVNEIDVAHDDGCALLKTEQPCNCDPDVSVRPRAQTQPPRRSAVSSISPALTALAAEIAQRLNAKPAPEPPARAVFDGGVIHLNQTEIAIEFTDIGAFFVNDINGQIVVEGVVSKELDRTEKRHRHRKLQKLGKKIFGDDKVIHDPLGHMGGSNTPAS